MKKVFVLCACAAVLAVAVAGIFLYTDGVSYDRAAFEKQISGANNGRVEIRSEKDIGDIKAVVFTRDGDVGKAILVRNMLGRYKMVETGCGTGRQFRCSADKVNGRYYFVLAGKNLGNAEKAAVRLSGTDGDGRYFESGREVDIPAGEYFIVAEELGGACDYNNNFSASTVFYDKGGKDVTKSMVNHDTEDGRGM